MRVGMSERGLGTLCRLFGYTRQAYYQQRVRVERSAVRSELVLREVANIREQQKRIGVRKLWQVLGRYCTEHAIEIGRDALFDLLRENSLLVRRRRCRKPRTTLSYRWMRRYPNLIKDFTPTAANQLWVSDITYIRIMEGFGYLSLVTDAYSRKIVGYHLNGDLSAKGCVSALKMAIKNNPEREGLIHHSDRGLQYYSTAYVELLGPETQISMTENGDPRENAIAERVNGILKDELLEQKFGRLSEARAAIGKAVSIYNHVRLHMSIDMLTPAIAHKHRGQLKRHWKNYYRSSPLDPGEAMASAIASPKHKTVNTVQD